MRRCCVSKARAAPSLIGGASIGEAGPAGDEALAAELRATLKALPGVADADIHLELTEMESQQRAEAAIYRAARDAASAEEGTRASTGTIYRAGRRRK